MNRSYYCQNDRTLLLIVSGLVAIVQLYFTVIVFEGLQAKHINQATEALLHVQVCRSPYTGVRIQCSYQTTQ